MHQELNSKVKNNVKCCKTNGTSQNQKAIPIELFSKRDLVSDLNRASKNSINDLGKKEKFKSSSSKNKNNLGTNLQYNHLDFWLETYLKDLNTPQLSSSSEFLDYNTSELSRNTYATENKKTRKIKQSFRSPSVSQHSQIFEQHPLEIKLPVQNSKYFEKVSVNCNHTTNYQLNCDYASLPPIENPFGIEDLSPNLTKELTHSNRRFSDPGLLNQSNIDLNNANDNVRSNKDSKPPRSNIFIKDKHISNKVLYSTLLEQINILHETNTNICRKLEDTKIDIETIKDTPYWNIIKLRRDSVSGLSTHSQPVNVGQSSGSTFHTDFYTPGMMTDVVREVKEAARIREDALINRVKSVVEDRSWSLGANNSRMMKDIEDLKSQMQYLKKDKEEATNRIIQLESEIKHMRQLIKSFLASKKNEIRYETETSRLNQSPNRTISPRNKNLLNTHKTCSLCQSDQNQSMIPNIVRSRSTSVHESYCDANEIELNNRLQLTDSLPKQMSNEVLCTEIDCHEIQTENKTKNPWSEFKETCGIKNVSECPSSKHALINPKRQKACNKVDTEILYVEHRNSLTNVFPQVQQVSSKLSLGRSIPNL